MVVDLLTGFELGFIRPKLFFQTECIFNIILNLNLLIFRVITV